MQHSEQTKQKARQLKENGETNETIANSLSISSSTVSLWCRDLIVKKQISRQNPEKRASRGTKQEQEEKMSQAQIEAVKEWDELSINPDFSIGLGIWFGEGFKNGKSLVSLGNTDPRLLVAFIRFLSLVGIQNEELTFDIQVASNSTYTETEIEHWWSTSLNLPVEQRGSLSKDNKNYKKQTKYPYGVCTIRVFDRYIRTKIDVWAKIALGSDS